MNPDRYLMLTVGLPGCGKTTWAKAWREQDPDHRILMSRDDHRRMLFDRLAPLHEDPQEASRREQVIDRVLPAAVTAALRAGWSVCVHDTNLDPERVADLRAAAAYLCPVAFHDMRDVPPDRVLLQNEARRGTSAHVPPGVIFAMAKRYNVPGWLEGAIGWLDNDLSTA